MLNIDECFRKYVACILKWIKVRKKLKTRTIQLLILEQISNEANSIMCIKEKHKNSIYFLK